MNRAGLCTAPWRMHLDAVFENRQTWSYLYLSWPWLSFSFQRLCFWERGPSWALSMLTATPREKALEEPKYLLRNKSQPSKSLLWQSNGSCRWNGADGVIYLDFTRLVSFSWSFLKNTFINNLENYELDLKTFEGDYHTWAWHSKCKNLLCVLQRVRKGIISQSIKEISRMWYFSTTDRSHSRLDDWISSKLVSSYALNETRRDPGNAKDGGCPPVRGLSNILVLKALFSVLQKITLFHVCSLKYENNKVINVSNPLVCLFSS